MATNYYEEAASASHQNPNRSNFSPYALKVPANRQKTVIKQIHP